MHAPCPSDFSVGPVRPICPANSELLFPADQLRAARRLQPQNPKTMTWLLDRTQFAGRPGPLRQALGPIATAGGGSSPARPQRPAAGRDWLPPRQELEAQPVGNKKASGRCRRPPQPTHPPLLLLTAQRTTSSVHCIHLYERRAWKMGGA
jgi:hypothetical protein